MEKDGRINMEADRKPPDCPGTPCRVKDVRSGCVCAELVQQRARVAELEKGMEEYACTGGDTPCGCYDLLSKDKARVTELEGWGWVILNAAMPIDDAAAWVKVPREVVGSLRAVLAKEGVGMSDKLKAHLLHMAAVRPLMDGEAARWAVGRIAELEARLASTAAKD